MFFENIVNHIVLLFFFSASYMLGRFLFAKFLCAVVFGISVLSFVIYTIFLSVGINLITVSLLYAIMSVPIIRFSIINRFKVIEFNKKVVFSSFPINRLFNLEFLILCFFLLIYLIYCSFPLTDGDAIAHYCYLPKLYISGGNFSVGNTLPHGDQPILYQSLLAFLAYFGTIDIAPIFNFYLTLLIILTLYGMCSINIPTQEKINSNSFCLIACIFLANTLMQAMVQSGRPYILVAYFSSALIYFLAQNFFIDKKKFSKIYILFLGTVGGALVSVNYLGLAIFGCLLIALCISNYNRLSESLKPIVVGGLFAAIYSLPFYLRTYSITGHLIYMPSSIYYIERNEFAGFLGPIKALFILSTRNNQQGMSCCVGILYLSFFPILLQAIVKQHLWNIRQMQFLFVFIISFYFVWLSKIPVAHSLIGIFPPYLLLLYLLIDFRKLLYKYAIYLFCGVMMIYCVFQFIRLDYLDYMIHKQSKADFVYSKLSKWRNDGKTFKEENEIINYINSNFSKNDVVFCNGVFSLTLLKNKVYQLGTEKREPDMILLSPNTVIQPFKPLKHFKSYTIYEYK